MKHLFITDKNIGLTDALFDQKYLYQIEGGKSLIGQITYSIDFFVSAGFEVIYLTNTEHYQTICQICKKIVNIQSNKQVRVINLDSDLIGKNNLALKITEDKSLDEILRKYNVQSIIIYNQEYQNSKIIANHLI